MNIYIPYTRLPSAYQEVEYIENTGTTQVQYIDTGVTATANISMELVMTPNTSYTNGEYAIMGTDWTSQGIFLMFYKNVWRYHQGGSYGDISGISDAKTTVAMSSTGFSVNGTSTSFSAGSDYTRGGTILLFTTRSVSTNPSRYKVSKFKTHELKIWDSGTLVRDLVPCYRKSDSVIGLYDLVNNQFYTNQGTGTFSKGNDVSMSEVQNIYIGEYGWKPGENTLAYYPLETDTNDYSGNNRNGTNNGVTFSGGLGVFNGSSYISLGTGSWTNIQTNMTISVWFNWNGSGVIDNAVVGKMRYAPTSYLQAYYGITVHEEDRYLCIGTYNGSDWNLHPLNFRTTSGGSPTLGPVTQSNKWYHAVLTVDGTTKKAYIDGVLVATETSASTSSTDSIDTRIGSFVRYNYDSYFNGNISKVIFEDKTWTADEIQFYYNMTKKDYGL